MRAVKLGAIAVLSIAGLALVGYATTQLQIAGLNAVSSTSAPELAGIRPLPHLLAPRPAEAPRPESVGDEKRAAEVHAGKATPPAVKSAPSPTAPPAPHEDATLNLRANRTADVYLDDKKLGTTPLESFKTKARTYQVRFDCYDSAGNVIPGENRAVIAKPNEEQLVEFSCPEE